MENPKRFYTYAYLREDRTPYYIGKGTGVRVYKKYKGEVNLPKDKSRIIFLKKNITENEAFKHEIYMISVFGRKDLGTGILRNRTDGGEGSSGVIVTEKTKEKLRQLKGGKNHPLYGKKHSEDTKKLQSTVKLGKNNPFYGKNHNQEWKNMILDINCVYEYKITNPSNEIVTIRNLAQFCRKNNLHNGAMCLVSDGKRKHHKNWKVEKTLVCSLKEKGG